MYIYALQKIGIGKRMSSPSMLFYKCSLLKYFPFQKLNFACYDGLKRLKIECLDKLLTPYQIDNIATHRQQRNLSNFDHMTLSKHPQ